MIQAIYLAFQALAANKLRAGLTMLGTIIGVGCVVALWNVGLSGRRYMSDALESFGKNVIFVHPRHSSDEEDQRRFRYRPLGLGDVAAIEAFCPSVDQASPCLSNYTKVVYGATFRQVRIYGCFPSFLAIRDWKIERGAAFSASDERSGNRVVLLGATVARELFGTVDPVGATVRLEREPFVVIGVLKSKGSFFGEDQDNVVLAPYTSLADNMGWGRNVHVVFVSAHTKESIPQAKNEIRLAVRASQKLPPSRKDSVELQDLGEVTAMVDQVLVGFSLLLGAIGAISLLVGGIGIMNIMLVSVTERTKEIGLRMALGAKDIDILMQFLVEAMVLGGTGGVLGVVGGLSTAFGTVQILSLVLQRPWPFVVSIPSLLLAVAFAAAVGLFFGLYPAWRASRLDPIEALRRE